NQSKINNNHTDSLDAEIYLFMKVQYYNETLGQWADDDTVYDGTTPLNISATGLLKLDQYFNGKWNTTANASYGEGTYRVYAAVTDENNVVLENMDGTYLNATFNFTIESFSVAIGLSNPLAFGISWDIEDLPANNLSANGNNNVSVTQYNVSVVLTGSYTVDLYIQANDNLINPSNGILLGLGNETYCYNTTNSTVPGIACSVLDTEYAGNQIGSGLSNGDYVYLKFYLNVPATQSPGNYNNTVNIKGVQTGQSP
ncbi:MAG: hypothetical protein KAI55_04525, partial [Candidatus Aenigmarchaeota archaeon]|nr:hypothetical protein [Candidatus Aenigmarchaeota archaeon]